MCEHLLDLGLEQQAKANDFEHSREMTDALKSALSRHLTWQHGLDVADHGASRGRERMAHLYALATGELKPGQLLASGKTDAKPNFKTKPKRSYGHNRPSPE